MEIAKKELLGFMDHSVPTIFIIYVALTGGEAIQLALTYVAGGVLMFLAALFYLKDIKIKRPNMESIKSYWEFALPGFFSKLVSQFGNKVDIVMVQLFWGSSNVGFYAAGKSSAMIVSGLIAGIGILIFPTISRYHAKGDWDSLQKAVVGASRYTTLFISPVIIFLVLFPEKIISIMISNAFLPASPIVRILAINSFFLLYSRPFRQIFGGTNRPGLGARISVAGNLVNVGLNVLLIPDSLFGITLAGWAEVGAAIATLTSGIIITITSMLVSKRIVDWTFSPSVLYHISAAIVSGAMLYILESQVMLITRFYHLFIYGTLMVAIYLAILYIAGEFTRKDWGYIIESINPKEMAKYVKEELTGKSD